MTLSTSCIIYPYTCGARPVDGNGNGLAVGVPVSDTTGPSGFIAGSTGTDVGGAMGFKNTDAASIQRNTSSVLSSGTPVLRASR